MINDRLNLYKKSSAFKRCSRRESSHIKDKMANSKVHLFVNGYSMPINFIVTDGSRTDRKKVIHLIKNINAKLIFAVCAYDIDKILLYFKTQNIKPIISPKHNHFDHRDNTGSVLKILSFSPYYLK